MRELDTRGAAFHSPGLAPCMPALRACASRTFAYPGCQPRQDTLQTSPLPVHYHESNASTSHVEVRIKKSSASSMQALRGLQ